MDEQQRPVNPYRTTPPVTPAQPPQHQPQPASFGSQLSAIAKDATLSAARAAADRIEQKPQATGNALLWIGVVLGILGVFGGALMFSDSLFSGIGTVLFGLAMVLPCAQPLRCRSRDRKAVAAWEQEQARNRELAGYLTEEDAAIAAALTPTPPPARTPRHRAPVWITTAVLLALSMVCIGLGDDTLQESNLRYEQQEQL
ncbi:hypothetical protein [uncultured Corynebacterium sp.]|uniref:hypothetical protein n=1 Tax=uncultured Corynebacterium sp. TaxID=159447 RepID=UPI0025DD7E7E|nr:hypothetical protein [uncultured Corynebacterium sp.]